MTTTFEYFKQSELAFAAYASLTPGTPDLQKLRDVDMTATEAEKFSSSWRVLDQHTDPSSGLSATIFQQVVDGNPTGPKYLAIRGTEPNAADLTADGLLALGLPASLIPQFAALKAHLDTVWLADGGKLHGKTFTVTGHSLG
ncbi:MAG: hypothetical protein RBS40_15480 [Rhodocyclaceae bacterium]|jgi:hypothetical protein|nr:hypothetical protein [Rhodocyclaceae bacterium]